MTQSYSYRVLELHFYHLTFEKLFFKTKHKILDFKFTHFIWAKPRNSGFPLRLQREADNAGQCSICSS